LAHSSLLSDRLSSTVAQAILRAWHRCSRGWKVSPMRQVNDLSGIGSKFGEDGMGFGEYRQTTMTFRKGAST
jgi:hypothetical protein